MVDFASSKITKRIVKMYHKYNVKAPFELKPTGRKPKLTRSATVLKALIRIHSRRQNSVFSPYLDD